MPTSTLPGAYADEQIALAEVILGEVSALAREDIAEHWRTPTALRILRLLDTGASRSDIVVRVYRWLVWSGGLREGGRGNDRQREAAADHLKARALGAV